MQKFSCLFVAFFKFFRSKNSLKIKMILTRWGVQEYGKPYLFANDLEYYSCTKSYWESQLSSLASWNHSALQYSDGFLSFNLPKCHQDELNYTQLIHCHSLHYWWCRKIRGWELELFSCSKPHFGINYFKIELTFGSSKRCLCCSSLAMRNSATLSAVSGWIIFYSIGDIKIMVALTLELIQLIGDAFHLDHLAK